MALKCKLSQALSRLNLALTGSSIGTLSISLVYSFFTIAEKAVFVLILLCLDLPSRLTLHCLSVGMSQVLLEIVYLYTMVPLSQQRTRILTVQTTTVLQHLGDLGGNQLTLFRFTSDL